MKIILKILVILLAYGNIYSQTFPSPDHFKTNIYKIKSTSSAVSFTAISIGLGTFLYLVNPVILYENKRIYAGLTKEISVGFGKMGQNRVAFEYSLIFSGNISNHLRFSFKYDFLLKENIKPSHNLQGTGVLSPGAGYFTNFDKQGFFPELSFGYSLRNHKILIYPHIKIRHTFMFGKTDADITDLSFGIIFGFANPFIDVNIKRQN